MPRESHSFDLTGCSEEEFCEFLVNACNHTSLKKSQIIAALELTKAWLLVRLFDEFDKMEATSENTPSYIHKHNQAEVDPNQN